MRSVRARTCHAARFLSDPARGIGAAFWCCFAALINSETLAVLQVSSQCRSKRPMSDGRRRTVSFFDECRELGIELQPPLPLSTVGAVAERSRFEFDADSRVAAADAADAQVTVILPLREDSEEAAGSEVTGAQKDVGSDVIVAVSDDDGGSDDDFFAELLVERRRADAERFSERRRADSEALSLEELLDWRSTPSGQDSAIQLTLSSRPLPLPCASRPLPCTSVGPGTCPSKFKIESHSTLRTQATFKSDKICLAKMAVEFAKLDLFNPMQFDESIQFKPIHLN